MDQQKRLNKKRTIAQVENSTTLPTTSMDLDKKRKVTD